MKKIALPILLIALINGNGLAQTQTNTYPYPENAPLGIGTTNPKAKLHVQNGST